MNDAQVELFIQLIAARTGLQIRPQDRSALCQKILSRIDAAKIASPEKYHQILATQSHNSETEWRELTLLLTTNESYFMRDKGQFLILKKVILPELIAHKIKSYKTLGIKPTLRIWSAGCSTGEEPYSLVIILKQLISDWQNWTILVLGTDINQSALEKAQRGIYSPWSFRLVDPELQRQYFDRRKTEWEIDPKLRQLVRFSGVNLVTDNFPNIYTDIHNIDLILCRNVFVYFEKKYILQVLKKFAKTLRPGGYLMTGHAEVHNHVTNEFQSKVFPESVVYQTKNVQGEEQAKINCLMGQKSKATPIFGVDRNKKQFSEDSGQLLGEERRLASFCNGYLGQIESVLTAGSELGKIIRNCYIEADIVSNKVSGLQAEPAAEKADSPTSGILVLEAKACFKNKAYFQAIHKAKQAIDLQAHNFEANYLLAQIYANLGEYSLAIEYCNRASQVDTMSVFPYYLQAQIAEEQDDLETAKFFIKKAIYICPSFVSAYLELGNIYNKEGKLNKAIKMYNSSCDLLRKLPPYTLIEQQGKMTATQLLIDIKKKLVKLYSQPN